MIVELEQFLAAGDLGIAAHAVEMVTEVCREDAAQLTEIVVSWAPPQAVANLLMHPTIIPPDHRVSALLRGLATDVRNYPLVAAIVGLREFSLPEEYRRSVANRLLDIASIDAGSLASLASVTLVAYLDDVFTGDVLARFDHFGPTARHNVLVRLLDMFGIGDLHKHVALAQSNGTLHDLTADEIDQRLSGFAAQGGGLYLLEPIPDLTEWNAKPGPASYPGS